MAGRHNRRLTPQYLRLLFGMRRMELRSYLHDAVLKPRPDAKHVLIFAQGRSGTTLLESLLCSTGNFTGLGEPLHLHTREVWATVRHLRGLGRGAQGNVVAHVKGSQLLHERRRPVDPYRLLRSMSAEGWSIVHVRRQGIANQVLSECLARSRGAYHKIDDSPEQIRPRIDPQDFLMRYDRRLRFHEEDQAALAGVPHLSLVYEHDLMDSACHQATADRVCDWLDLPRHPVRTELRRIGARAPADQISNYDEIVSALEARGFDWFNDASEIRSNNAGVTPDQNSLGYKGLQATQSAPAKFS